MGVNLSAGRAGYRTHGGDVQAHSDRPQGRDDTADAGRRSRIRPSPPPPLLRSHTYLYNLVVSYDRKTACTVVNRRGDALTRDVKMNSNRMPFHLVMMNRACTHARGRPPEPQNQTSRVMPRCQRERGDAHSRSLRGWTRLCRASKRGLRGADGEVLDDRVPDACITRATSRDAWSSQAIGVPTCTVTPGQGRHPGNDERTHSDWCGGACGTATPCAGW